ncbi:DMT family transporter [Glutamicibacter sp.]|uniref:DMT family transporter n=1 Tax=Glutamicibacter sp. TaxID=1931995 RepID=UPI003D6A101C
MHWGVLIVSGLFEAVWAIALGMSEGFSKLVPTIVFFAALAVSMGGLAYAMKEIPVGTAYAIWVGIGASLAVIYSMATGQEAFSVLKMVFILGLVGCIIGLKAVSH